MAAGIARLIEICFVASLVASADRRDAPDASVTTVTSPFQHLPPFVSELLFVRDRRTDVPRHLSC